MVDVMYLHSDRWLCGLCVCTMTDGGCVLHSDGWLMVSMFKQEVKSKPGDIRPRLLENMALIATKQKQNVERALSAFMDICSNEVSNNRHLSCVISNTRSLF